MAKFKVGDKVKQTDGPGKGATGQIVNIYPLRPDMVASMGFGEYAGHDMVTFMGPQGKSIVPEDWLVANAKACNGAFKKGDRVVFVKSGDGGTVQEVYGDEWYAVQRDGANNPDKVQGFQIRAANGCARNSRNPVVAKAMNAAVRNADFKTGDIVVPFSSAVDWCTDAIDTLRTGQASSAQRMLQQAKAAAQEVTKYPDADAGYRGLMRKGLQLLDAAIANPTEASISAARKVLEEGRARAAGTSPRTTFNARRARNAAFTMVLAKDGNKLNDFIRYEYMDADEKLRRGEIPYVRKDILVSSISNDLARLKNRVNALTKRLDELSRL